MSNLLKQCFVVNSTEGNRIINSDRYMKEHMSIDGGISHEKTSDDQNEQSPEAEAFPSFEEEKAKIEQFRKDMIANAQTMANEITSTAQSEANGILDAAKQSARQ